MKSWSGSCPETKATRKTIDPKLDPIVDFRTCADTELMWATNGRETNDIVGMSETDCNSNSGQFSKTFYSKLIRQSRGPLWVQWVQQ